VSKNIIHDFLAISDTHKPYIAWSGGKDSTALLYLVLSVNKNIPVMRHVDNSKAPEIGIYAKKIESFLKFKADEVKPPFDVLEYLKINQINITEDIYAKNNFAKIYFYDIVEQFRISNQFTGCFLGLRKEESHGRFMNYKKRGAIYRKKNGELICQPLANWSTRDVFAFLTINKIPINPLYFYIKFKKTPENIRLATLLPSTFVKKGEALWIKYYWPDFFNQLCEISPQLNQYV
jgi:3'-phosphoadenosine 5'-phosphosulfate sulfotransferase (PAPS reductase)/FAD synthetase